MKASRMSRRTESSRKKRERENRRRREKERQKLIEIEWETEREGRIPRQLTGTTIVSAIAQFLTSRGGGFVFASYPVP